MLRVPVRAPLVRHLRSRRLSLAPRAMLRAAPLSRAVAALWPPASAPRFLSLLADLAPPTAADGAKAESPSDPPTLEAITARAAASIGLDDFTSDVLPALKVLAESLQLLGASDALASWTSSDWLLGLTVLAQHNSSRPSRPPRVASAPVDVSRDEMRALLRFVRLSDAVYADSATRFCEEAQLPQDVVVKAFDGGVLAPKYLLLRDASAKEIVLVVRGTASLLDFCTDICLMNEPFGDGQGHRGIVHAAKWLVKNTRADLEQLTRENPDFELVITGHSLGAGVAALAAMELKPDFPALRCIAFATPASVTEPLAEACADFVTTVVNGDDCVPRFHQHSMQRLQGEVSQFDWRAALKRMVDEEIEEQKSLVICKRDEQLQEIYDALQSIKKAQEDQAKEKLDQVLQTPVGRRVSASLELTKAAFWTDQSALERIASVKQIVQKQKQSGDDKKLWESVEFTVAGLESLAHAIHRPQEAQAVLSKSKALLASAGLDDADSDKTKEALSKTIGLDAFRDRIKSVIEQTTNTLHAEVQETVKDVSETVAVGVQVLKEGVDAAIEKQSAKLEAHVETIQEELARSTEAIVKKTQETALGVAAIAPLLRELDTPEQQEGSLVYGDGDGVDPDEQDDNEVLLGTQESLVGETGVVDTGAQDTTPSAAPTQPPEELLEPLFPPGRILYLNRHVASEAADAVELLHVTNDEFSRVVLSNAMILDHLCTAYERELQKAAKAMFEQHEQL